jgi:hypothetical protein
LLISLFVVFQGTKDFLSALHDEAELRTGFRLALQEQGVLEEIKKAQEKTDERRDLLTSKLKMLEEEKLKKIDALIGGKNRTEEKEDGILKFKILSGTIENTKYSNTNSNKRNHNDSKH